MAELTARCPRCKDLITATPDAGGGLNHVDVDLDASAYEAFAQIAKAQISTAQSLSVQQRFRSSSVDQVVESVAETQLLASLLILF